MKYLFFLLLIGLYFSQGFAQIINIEKKRMGATEKGWNGNIDFNLKYTKNTKEIWEFGNKAAFQYHQNKSNFLFLTDIKLIRTDNQDLINKGYAHLRYNRAFKDSGAIAIEAFSQVQYNGVQKIVFRNLSGGGFRIKLLGNDTINLNLGIAAMYEYEETSLQEFHRNMRGSNYFSFNWKLHEKIRVQTINYFQPLFNEFSDYRFSNESSLSLQLSKSLSFLITYSVLYDSSPVEGVPTTITSLNNSLRFKF